MVLILDGSSDHVVNVLRNTGLFYIDFKFVTAVDLNKDIKQIKYQSNLDPILEIFDLVEFGVANTIKK